MSQHTSLRSRIPLYVQIASTLRAEVIPDSSPGQALPTETELMDRFQVSRVTIRQALAQLVNEGFIRRYPGRGTFVVPRSEPRTVWNFNSLDDLITMRLNTDFQLLDFDTPPAVEENFEQRTLLGVDRIARIECMRWLAGVPVSYSEVYLPVDLAKALPIQDLPRAPRPCKPLIALLEERGAVIVAKGVQTLTAEAANKTVAARLWITPGSPVLVVERHYYDPNARLFHIAKVHYRSERGKYQFTFEKGKTS